MLVVVIPVNHGNKLHEPSLCIFTLDVDLTLITEEDHLIIVIPSFSLYLVTSNIDNPISSQLLYYSSKGSLSFCFRFLRRRPLVIEDTSEVSYVV